MLLLRCPSKVAASASASPLTPPEQTAYFVMQTFKTFRPQVEKR
jgi:hypothetical protein